ncbi:MAG TPA: hypothetical protein VGA78_07475 [Gemmatimonadales bacterium]|jgi:hypothetical protein
MASSAGSSDTSAEALRVQYRLYGAMTAAEKLKLVGELTLTASRFALAGLSLRFPEADQRELLLRLAALRLGEATVAQVYGWPATGRMQPHPPGDRSQAGSVHSGGGRVRPGVAGAAAPDSAGPRIALARIEVRGLLHVTAATDSGCKL